MDLTKLGSFYHHDQPILDDYYNFSPPQASGQDILTKYQHSSQRNVGYKPISTGSSVIGMIHKDGVIVSADNLVSYGSLARYRNCERVIKINSNIVMGCGGDYADFQFIRNEIEQRTIKDLLIQDKNDLKPRALFNWMTTILYGRRCEMKPLYIDLVIGGISNTSEPDDKPFLGCVSMRGKAYTGDVIATGFGVHLALPIMREFLRQKANNYTNIKKEEAEYIINQCQEVLYYRDCLALSRYTQGSVNRVGKTIVTNLEPKIINENWNISKESK